MSVCIFARISSTHCLFVSSSVSGSSLRSKVWSRDDHAVDKIQAFPWQTDPDCGGGLVMYSATMLLQVPSCVRPVVEYVCVCREEEKKAKLAELASEFVANEAKTKIQHEASREFFPPEKLHRCPPRRETYQKVRKLKVSACAMLALRDTHVMLIQMKFIMCVVQIGQVLRCP